MESTDFYINQRPVSISFECPHCKCEVEISWDEIDAPDYWGDDWGEVECPYCNKTVKLGEFDTD